MSNKKPKYFWRIVLCDGKKDNKEIFHLGDVPFLPSVGDITRGEISFGNIKGPMPKELAKIAAEAMKDGQDDFEKYVDECLDNHCFG